MRSRATLPSFALGLLGATLVGACGSAAPAPAVIIAPTPSDAELVKAAMPSIVLVVNSRDDRKTTWGAGFFFAPGKVLTAHHVVADKGKIAIMPFRPERPSYSPMDGGLKRFLFENTRDLVPAQVARVDAVSDLALLEIEGDLGQRPFLTWAGDDVRPGDRVYALGHPQETPWSFSAGVVGALQYGLIQHDATVGPGSSGGPLLNLRGEVVGVNVAQIVSEPVGLSFARPGHVVASAIGDSGSPATSIDVSTPTATALSCWRAQELALKEVGECFDWESEWRQYRSIIDEAAAHAPNDEVRARILGCARDGDHKARWIARRREKVARALDPSFEQGRKEQELDPADPELPPAVAALLRDGLAAWRRSESAGDSSFEADFRDPLRLRKRLRQGLRIEDTRRVAPDAEWVLLGSRNDDGTVAHFAELYVRIGDHWLQRGMPWPEDIERLPRGWPEPMETFAMKRALSVPHIVKKALHGPLCDQAARQPPAPGPRG